MVVRAQPAPASFLVKLRELLLKEDPEVISWDDTGQITIGKPSVLTDSILKQYFRHSNFSSFQRQLNYFGYYKVQGKGRFERCVYKNRAFYGTEGTELTPDALLQLRRKSSGGAVDDEDVARAQMRRRSSSRGASRRLSAELADSKRKRLYSYTESDDDEDDEPEEAPRKPLRRPATKRFVPQPKGDYHALVQHPQDPVAIPAQHQNAYYHQPLPRAAPEFWASDMMDPMMASSWLPSRAKTPPRPPGDVLFPLPLSPSNLVRAPSDEFLTRAAIVSARFDAADFHLLREPLIDEQLWSPSDTWETICRNNPAPITT